MPIIQPPEVIYRQHKVLNISVGTSAVQVDSAANVLPSFKWIILFNNHNSNKIYLGHDSGLTTANGMPLLPQDYWVMAAEDAPSFDLWVIADGASTDLRIQFLR